jgi:hypothetical protein
MTRFRDHGESIDRFQDQVLVRCPRCQSCALVSCKDPNVVHLFAPRRFSCQSCGAAKDWAGRAVGATNVGGPVDRYFHYPLWLQISCCGDILWAYNLPHLALIEAFVQAELRERQPDEQNGWSNRSIASRLPRWMQSRKNRDAILKAIATLHQSI